MTYTPPAHTTFQWHNLPATDTALSAANLIASQADIVSWVQTALSGLDTYIEAINDCRYSRLMSFGDSIAAGYGPPTAGSGFPTGYYTQGWNHRLAKLLGAEHVPYGQGGAAVVQDNTAQNPPGTTGSGHPGGWATVLATIRGYLTSDDVALSDLYTMAWAVNDAWVDNSTVSNTAIMFQAALTACVAAVRCGRFYGVENAAWAFTGANWSAQAGVLFDTWGGPRRTIATGTGAGNVATLTLPAVFPGGDCWAFFIANQAGGVASVAVDGSTIGSVDTTASYYNMGTFKGVLVALKLPALAAGSHTIVVTPTSYGATTPNIVLVGVGCEAPQLPHVLLPLMYKSAAAGGFSTTGMAHNPVTDADVATMNTAITAVANAFSSGVVTCDPGAAWLSKGLSYVGFGTAGSPYSDALNLHPSSLAHAIYAQTALNALRTLPKTVPPPTSSMLERQIQAAGGAGLPNGSEPILSTNWSATTPITMTRDSNGEVQLFGKVTKSSAASAAEQFLSLPVGYAPKQNRTFSLVQASGFTGLFASIVVNADGTVHYVAGDATAGINLDGITFYAIN